MIIKCDECGRSSVGSSILLMIEQAHHIWAKLEGRGFDPHRPYNSFLKRMTIGVLMTSDEWCDPLQDFSVYYLAPLVYGHENHDEMRSLESDSSSSSLVSCETKESTLLKRPRTRDEDSHNKKRKRFVDRWIVRWNQNFASFVAFVEEYNRLPSRSTERDFRSREENRLYTWLNNNIYKERYKN